MTTWKPEVGMKVRCVDDQLSSGVLKAGNLYEVETVPEGYLDDSGWEEIRLKGVESANGWCINRFAPVLEGTLDTYATLGAEIGRLVTEKQRSYGDSHGKAGDVMRILYPDGIKPEQMDDALTVTRILDKLFRLANQKDAFGESPYRDLVGYGLLGAAKASKK